MSPEVIRWIVAIAVVGHGIGHVLFAPLVTGSMKLDASGHSWLLTGMLGDGPTRAVASFVAAAVMTLFVIVAGGIATQSGWWRGLAIASAVASIGLVVVMWDGLPTGPAMWAVAFDAAVLGALLVLHWPSSEVIGA